MINQRLTGWLRQIFMTEPMWMNLNIYKNHLKIWKAVQHLEWHTCICNEDILWISKTFLAHVAKVVYSIYYCGRLNMKWDLDTSSFTVIGVQENKCRKCMFFLGKWSHPYSQVHTGKPTEHSILLQSAIHWGKGCVQITREL